MTTNQVKYWELVEGQRHNKAQEAMDAPLKAAQTLVAIEEAPKVHAETGLTKISSIVKGIEGFERFSKGLESLGNFATAPLKAAGAFF